MAEWLLKNRSEAEGAFQALPFPAAKDENFRFTSIEEIKFDDSLLPASVSDKLSSPLSLHQLEEADLALLVQNGAQSKFIGIKSGIQFSSLEDAASQGDLAFQKKLEPSKLFAQDKFAQLAMARWDMGAFLRVEKNTELEKPVRLVQWLGNKKTSAIRNLILLEEGANASLIIESGSDQEERVLAELSEIYLEKSANLHLIFVQNFGEHTKAFQRQGFYLAKNAQLKITSVHVGSEKIQVRKEVILAGENARVEMAEAARGNHHQHFDFWSDVKHEASRTVSAADAFFVMNGKSRAVFNGLVHVEKQALECDAYQKSKSLLLSSQATVHAIPKLIIQTDAVKCSHGASVSTVNPEQIHYLQSRGIPHKEAEQMIVHGFTEPVLAKIPHEIVYERAEAYLLDKSGSVMQ